MIVDIDKYEGHVKSTIKLGRHKVLCTIDKEGSASFCTKIMIFHNE